jgi:hypothetical protein
MDSPQLAVRKPPEPSPLVDSMDRFREIYQALGPGSRWWNDSAWLRFSAQAAVMGTLSPIESAKAIETVAQNLYQHAHWYDALASPLNMVVAATLVQTSDSVEAFTADVAPASHLLRVAGFHVSGSLLIKTVLMMRVLAAGANSTAPVIERMHQIYIQMKRKHWWLTGRGEVPVCALLSSITGTPEEISVAVEVIYKRLNDHHQLTAGRDLLTAAYILLLMGLPGTQATGRFIAIDELLLAKSYTMFHCDYLGIALLSLLDHEPDQIVQRLDKMKESLADLAPLQFIDVNSSIAADLVYLDLVGIDSQLHPFSQPDDIQRMKMLIRLQLSASLLLVQVPSIPAVEGGSTRWQA